MTPRLLCVLLLAVCGPVFAAAHTRPCERLNARVHLDEAALAGAVSGEDKSQAQDDLAFAESLRRHLCYTKKN